jgi:hypothetical protein
VDDGGWEPEVGVGVFGVSTESASGWGGVKWQGRLDEENGRKHFTIGSDGQIYLEVIVADLKGIRSQSSGYAMILSIMLTDFIKLPKNRSLRGSSFHLSNYLVQHLRALIALYCLLCLNFPRI